MISLCFVVHSLNSQYIQYHQTVLPFVTEIFVLKTRVYLHMSNELDEIEVSETSEDDDKNDQDHEENAEVNNSDENEESSEIDDQGDNDGANEGEDEDDEIYHNDDDDEDSQEEEELTEEERAVKNQLREKRKYVTIEEYRFDAEYPFLELKVYRARSDPEELIRMFTSCKNVYHDSDMKDIWGHSVTVYAMNEYVFDRIPHELSPTVLESACRLMTTIFHGSEGCEDNAFAKSALNSIERCVYMTC